MPTGVQVRADENYLNLYHVIVDDERINGLIKEYKELLKKFNELLKEIKKPIEYHTGTITLSYGREVEIYVKREVHHLGKGRIRFWDEVKVKFPAICWMEIDEYDGTRYYPSSITNTFKEANCINEFHYSLNIRGEIDRLKSNNKEIYDIVMKILQSFEEETKKRLELSEKAKKIYSRIEEIEKEVLTIIYNRIKDEVDEVIEEYKEMYKKYGDRLVNVLLLAAVTKLGFRWDTWEPFYVDILINDAMKFDVNMVADDVFRDDIDKVIPNELKYLTIYIAKKLGYDFEIKNEDVIRDLKVIELKKEPKKIIEAIDKAFENAVEVITRNPCAYTNVKHEFYEIVGVLISDFKDIEEVKKYYEEKEEKFYQIYSEVKRKLVEEKLKEFKKEYKAVEIDLTKYKESRYVKLHKAIEKAKVPYEDRQVILKAFNALKWYIGRVVGPIYISKREWYYCPFNIRTYTMEFPKMNKKVDIHIVNVNYKEKVFYSIIS